MNRPHASRLRQEVLSLQRERARLEEGLLRPLSLLRASLIKRHLGSGEQRRSKAAHYLSILGPDGRPRLLYVRQRDFSRVQREVESYRSYRAALRRLRILSPKIFSALKALLRSQEVSPPR